MSETTTIDRCVENGSERAQLPIGTHCPPSQLNSRQHWNVVLHVAPCVPHQIVLIPLLWLMSHAYLVSGQHSLSLMHDVVASVSSPSSSDVMPIHAELHACLGDGRNGDRKDRTPQAPNRDPDEPGLGTRAVVQPRV